MGISNKVCRLGIGDFKVEVIELHLLDLCGQFGIQSRSGQESIPVTVSASRHGKTQTNVINIPIYAKCAEKVYCILGKEFGEYAGKKAILVKAVYGLKSSGFAWRSLCADVLKEQLEFQPCRGDMDVWRRPCQRKDGGSKYYEYILVYTDDVIAILENPKAIMDKLNNFFVLKPDSIKEPITYLGATISKHKLDGDDYFTWAIGSEAYLQESLRVVKKRIAPMQLTLKRKVYSTLPTGYKPELDSTPFVDDDTAIFYM
ncbi:unnamed protein product [Cylindrotheca closterium]|uniref:Reverse transcriptase Ty1/copia-type domain-containing protein n=1 Tax=Cylindrotheca closterium TaxID=2856 RepID=A0AAD2JI14_9STRA|nr:unnamed protein product [Cylindrotheca closterium]